MRYNALLKGFLFFLRYGIKADGVDTWDFALFRPVCEALVQKGQFKPTILELFRPTQ